MKIPAPPGPRRRAGVDGEERTRRRGPTLTPKTFILHRQAWLRSDANRIANEAKFVKGQPRLPLRRAARALGRLEARQLPRS